MICIDSFDQPRPSLLCETEGLFKVNIVLDTKMGQFGSSIALHVAHGEIRVMMLMLLLLHSLLA